MPTYEYECQNCGHLHEALQKFSDDPLTKCPSCGDDGLKKLIGKPSFRLKGSGWYVNDYGNGHSVAAGKADSGNSPSNGNGSTKGNGSSKDSGSSSSSKSEAKADATPPKAKESGATSKSTSSSS